MLISLGPIQIRWYGLMFVMAFTLGFKYMSWVYRREGHDIQSLDSLLIYLVGGTIIGARIGHCLFYDPAYFLANPLEIFAIWKGGLASHGGSIGVIIAIYLFTRRQKISYLWLIDRLTIPTALAACFIRMGNFFNSEIVGVKASVPWAIVFERVDTVPRHPAQLYEAFSYLLTFVILFFGYKFWNWSSKRGLLLGLFLVLIFFSRSLIEIVKVKQAAYTLDSSLSTGQWLSIPFVLSGLVIIALSFRTKKESMA